MPDSPSSFPPIRVEKLKGLNEREQDSNQDVGEFDVLKGVVPTKQNTLTKINGIKKFHDIDGIGGINNLCQSNDSRGNIWISGETALGTIHEDEFFLRAPYNPNLVRNSLEEEEDFPVAIVTHSTASATDGGTYTTASNWQTAPLTEILSQINPDGSAAAFCSLAANQFTLTAGRYRIKGFRVLRNSTTTTGMQVRLWNATSGGVVSPTTGLGYTPFITNGDATNKVLHFSEIHMILSGSTAFEVQGIMSNAQTNTGFGLQSSVAGMRNLFCAMRILKMP